MLYYMLAGVIGNTKAGASEVGEWKLGRVAREDGNLVVCEAGESNET